MWSPHSIRQCSSKYPQPIMGFIVFPLLQEMPQLFNWSPFNLLTNCHGVNRGLEGHSLLLLFDYKHRSHWATERHFHLHPSFLMGYWVYQFRAQHPSAKCGKSVEGFQVWDKTGVSYFLALTPELKSGDRILRWQWRERDRAPREFLTQLLTVAQEWG